MKKFEDEADTESLKDYLKDFQALQNHTLRVPKDILECIKEGLSLEQARARLNWNSRQRVSKAISDYELSEIWCAAKNISRIKKEFEKTLRRQEHAKLLSILKTESVFKAYRTSWACGKAEEFIQSLSNRERQYVKSREFYTKLFEKYDAARKNRQRISYKQLARDAGVHPPYIRSVFKRLNLKSMFWTLEYKPRGSVTLDSLLAAYNLGLCMADIDYYLGRAALARQRMLNSGFKPVRQAGVYNGKKFSYSTASKVYEAADLGFAPKDISNLVEKTENVVKSIIQKRQGVEGTIISALKLLHEGKDFSKPYHSGSAGEA
jgi:hypothetical protein